MTKRKISWELYSYGIYSPWNKSSREIPKLLDITTLIPIQQDMEFGYLLKIKGAKGKTIEFIIEHPPMIDENSNTMPPFEGTCFIDSNDYEFFLGDTVWEPYAQMAGNWRLITKLEGKTIADKKLTLIIKESTINN